MDNLLDGQNGRLNEWMNERKNRLIAIHYLEMTNEWAQEGAGWERMNECDAFFDEEGFYQIMPTKRKREWYPNTTPHREKRQVKSIMDERGGREREREGTSSATLLCLPRSLSLSRSLLRSLSFDGRTSTMRKTKDDLLEGYYVLASGCVCVCVSDDKCVSCWCKLKYKKNSQEALVHNYSDESLARCRSDVQRLSMR